MKITELSVPGVLLIEPKVFGDARGYFFESFQAERYAEAGLKDPFVQDNFSLSRRGVLRGLHFQNPQPQGKLVSVLQGEVFDVAVDIRRGSPTFGKWAGAVIGESNKHQLWVPPNFAHGFVVLSEQALFAYKCTALYQPEAEGVIQWNDPDLGIDWRFDGEPALSARDQKGIRLRDFPAERLPTYAL